MTSLMKLSTCCHSPVVNIEQEFEGDYPYECTNCGRYFEEGGYFFYAFTSDLVKFTAVSE